MVKILKLWKEIAEMAKLQKNRELIWDVCDNGSDVFLTPFLMENTILVSIFYVLFVMSTVRIVKVEEVEILIVFICWCLLGYVGFTWIPYHGQNPDTHGN